MKRKASIIAAAAVLSAAMSVPAFALETESLIGNTKFLEETESEQEQMHSTEETEENMDNRNVFLTDVGYEAGLLNENGWFSRFLELEYVPKSGDVYMSSDLNDTLQGYYSRNGDENMIASSEFVATMDINNMIQVTAETNPDNEKAEDILKSFIDVDALEEAGEMQEMELGDLQFLSTIGKSDGRDCFMAVSTMKDGIVVEMRCVFDSEENRDAMLAGFASFNEDDMEKACISVEETEAETAASKDHGNEKIS